VSNDNRMPTWSPDNRATAFTRVGTNGPNIETMLADGSVLTARPFRASSAVLGLPRVWSAAGELFFSSPPFGNADIEVISVEGDEPPRKVVATEYLELDPALSPDGRWLAYTSTRTGRNEVWVQRYPDGVATRISTNGGYEPRWSGDGRELFYLQGSAMMAVALEAGAELSFAAPVELFRGRYLAQPAIILSSYDVARDGRFLMIELPETSTRTESTGIVVVQNWTEELKRRVPGKSGR
jgi:serine/threonine-protein kinase